MYRFLMVDDEEIVRRGFETRIDWRSHGFEFLSPCENGRDAMTAIEEYRPDVVMTDICMPHSDGIALSAWIAERYPDIIVVVLSGYDEFGYAQAAIRNQVYDYVLKPVSARELSSLLLRLRGKLDAEGREKEDRIVLSERAGRTDELLRERSLEDFLSGAQAAPSAAVFAELFGFDPGNLSCAAAVLENDTAESGTWPPPGIAAAAGRARRSLVFFPSEGRAGILVFERDALKAEETVLAAVRAVGAMSGANPPRIGIGRGYADWVDLPRAWEEAVDALVYRLFREPGEPCLYRQATEESREGLELLREREDRLKLGLRSGARENIPALAAGWLKALDAAGLSPQRVRHEVQGLFARAAGELSEMGVPARIVEDIPGGDWFKYIASMATPREFEESLLRLADIASGALESRGLREPEWKVLDFKELIARHYAEHDLCVAKAAERLSISESYLSKILRRHLSCSFVDYLAEYRVEKAKELLLGSDMMTYEIAEAVGITDARYFSSVFKRHAGLTPSEFRQTERGAR